MSDAEFFEAVQALNDDLSMWGRTTLRIIAQIKSLKWWTFGNIQGVNAVHHVQDEIVNASTHVDMSSSVPCVLVSFHQSSIHDSEFVLEKVSVSCSTHTLLKSEFYFG